MIRTHFAKLLVLALIVLPKLFWLETSSSSSFKKNLLDKLFEPSLGAPFSFGACLVVKDDNKHLWEWLAYHYTVLPLRHLVIAMDPFSLTSPEPVLQKFREIGMNILLWKDKDYNFQKGSDFLLQEYDENVTGSQRLMEHIGRQKKFFTACLRKFKENNKGLSSEQKVSWTALLDSDEFLTFNNYHPNEEAPGRCHRTSNPQKCEDDFYFSVNSTGPRSRLPLVGQKTIAHFMHSEQQLFQQGIVKQEPEFLQFQCLCLPRVMFGGLEDDDTNQQSQLPSPKFNASHFYTLRFHKHRDKHAQSACKSIVNVLRYNGVKIVSPHKALRKLCNTAGPFPRYEDSLFRFQHYTGSLEDFISRPGDAHRSTDQYNYRNNFTVAGKDESLQGWLEAFSRQVGLNKALQLTEEIRAWVYESEKEWQSKIMEKKLTILQNGSDVLV